MKREITSVTVPIRPGQPRLRKASLLEYAESVADAVREPLVLLDNKLKVVAASRAFCDLFGVEPEETVGRMVGDLGDGQLDIPELRELLKTILSEKTNFVDYEVVRDFPTSGKRVMLLSARQLKIPLRNEQVILLTIVDATERRLLEHKYRQSSDEWQKTFDSISSMVSLQDTNCRLVRVNKAYADVFKKTPQEMVGKLCYETVHGTHECIPNCPHQETIRSGKPSRIELYEPSLGMYVEIDTSPTFAEDGHVSGSVHIVQNIDERKHAEQKLLQAREALAAVNSRLEARDRRNALLSEMREMLQACTNVQEVPPIVVSCATRALPDTSGALFLLRNSRSDMQLLARWGDFPDDADSAIFRMDACWALRRGRIYAVEDMAVGPVCPHLQSSSSVAYVCLPLVGKGETLGLLHFGIRPPGPEEHQGNFSEMQETAVMLAEYLSLSIANIGLWEQLAIQSTRDPLTGLFNRRYMEETVQREILRAARKEARIGIVMADIDHFKRVNDTYGHDAGDEVLVKLTDFLRRNTRGSDIACRYGGEEFILVLPDSATADTLTRAEYLREGVKNLKVESRGQPLPSVTLSLGIATYPDNGLEMNDLIRVADKALYEAKEQGRDRVIVGR